MLGGDKGYRRVALGDEDAPHSLGGSGLLLTKSAADAKDDDADLAEPADVTRALSRRDVVVHERFAHHRGVVERVIGMAKSISKFVSGPIFVRQSQTLQNVLLVVAALINWRLEANSLLFTSKGADADVPSDDMDLE